MSTDTHRYCLGLPSRAIMGWVSLMGGASDIEMMFANIAGHAE